MDALYKTDERSDKARGEETRKKEKSDRGEEPDEAQRKIARAAPTDRFRILVLAGKQGKEREEEARGRWRGTGRLTTTTEAQVRTVLYTVQHLLTAWYQSVTFTDYPPQLPTQHPLQVP